MHLTLIDMQTDCQSCKIPPKTVQCLWNLSVPLGFFQQSSYLEVPILQLQPGPEPSAQLSPGTSYSQPLISWIPYGTSSHCCCNKLPPTKWLKTIQMWYLLILEVRILKRVSVTGLQSGCWHGRIPFEGSQGEENSFPHFFQLLEDAHIPWLVAPFLHLQSKRPQFSFAK